MGNDDDRAVAPMAEAFRRDAEIPLQRAGGVEGMVFDKAEISFKLLLANADGLMLKVFRKKGSIDPEHVHDDHVSICCLLTGRLKMNIGGKEVIAGPGDVWQHLRGVRHSSEALEDCSQIEFKSPPRRTWS
jgi:quercetin dioxygenase-like cupin family protein